MVVDRYYSSHQIADQLAELIPDDVHRVFDPAVGEGALLSAVERRFGAGLAYLGADLDPRAVTSVRSAHPSWLIGKADTWESRSIVSSPVWRVAQDGSPIFAVMNPPFSFRGGRGQTVEVSGIQMRLSPAVAFVTQLISKIPGLTGILAVLPEGALYNVRDGPAWAFIRAHYDVSVVKQLSARAFAGATANTAIVQFSKRSSEPLVLSPKPALLRLGLQCLCVDVIRGRFPHASAASKRSSDDSVEVVHSTDLRGTELSRRFGPESLATYGTALLLPRVGPSPRGRIREVRRKSLVLTDCVMALRPRREELLDPLHASLVNGMDGLERLYRGTGARHITLVTLIEFLEHSGWRARHVEASSPYLPCQCRNNDPELLSTTQPLRNTVLRRTSGQ